MTAAIREAVTHEDFALARALFIEYAQWLKVDLCFQDFDRELATLPGAYTRPHGRLLLAGEAAQAFGCIALRPLAPDGDVASGATLPLPRETGEVKRLYVQPAARKGGWGRKLIDALLVEARAIGYRELKLDTLEWMSDARVLYAKQGFRECAAYYDNPLPGAVYMGRAL
jgi:putative acetyltransferase